MVQPLPKLRPLNVRAIDHNGHPYIHLQDPEEISPHQMIVPQPLAAILAFVDGNHDVDALCAAFQRRYGFVAPAGMVHDLLAALDTAAMLDNERAQQMRAEALFAYRSAPARPPKLAGLSYPVEPEALWTLLQDYLEGAGALPQVHSDRTRAVGLLSPHIDYPRGGHVYAQTWARAAHAAQEADLVILFGTDHHGSDPFTLTRQSYATPYGVLPTAITVVDAVADVIGAEEAYAGELRHRNEHSLELVAVWLHHVRAGKPVELAPILVGGFYEFMGRNQGPEKSPLVQQVLDTLCKQCQGRRVLVLASGDLAHVGSAFDGPAADDQVRAQINEADNRLLAHMAAGDAHGFFHEIKRKRNAHNVCGVAPIYLAMQLLTRLNGEPVRGEAAGYAECPADANNTSVVTVAGMLFT